MSQQLTTANKILVAAAHLDREKDTFTAEDLIVRAWSEFPESFGLSGYAQSHPDSNRILAKIMGSVGLCSRGWLEQVSTKVYRMTASGRKYALALESGCANEPKTKDVKKTSSAKTPAARRKTAPVKTKGEHESARAASRAERPTVVSTKAPAKAAHVMAMVASPSRTAARPVSKPETPPDREEPVAKAPVTAARFDPSALRRLVTSVANQKWARGSMVTFADACAFWGISPGIHAAQLEPRLSDVDAVLKGAAERIESTKAAIEIDGGIEVTLTTVVGLQGLHRTMLQKYSREIDAIRARGEER